MNDSRQILPIGLALLLMAAVLPFRSTGWRQFLRLRQRRALNPEACSTPGSNGLWGGVWSRFRHVAAENVGPSPANARRDLFQSHPGCSAGA